MSLSAAEIGAVCDSLNQSLRGAVVRKVLSPERPDRLVIELRSPSQNHYLQVVTVPGVSRLGRLDQRPSSADEPHPFVMQLRKDLVGLFFEGAEQLGGDRVVRLTFIGAELRFSLLCELTAPHPNVFWLDASGRIRGALYPNRNPSRALHPGELYQPPEPHPAPVQARCRFDIGPQLESLIEQTYAELETLRERKQLLTEVRQMLGAALRHQKRVLSKLEQDRLQALEGERLSAFGQLLKAYLYMVKKGASKVDVFDFEGQPVTIPLDPALSPVENMQRLFARAKRLQRAVPQIDQRIGALSQQLEWLELCEMESEEAPIERLEELKKELSQRYARLARKGAMPQEVPQERLPYREFAIASGHLARVGRSASDNDALTLRHARPEDLWLHVRGLPGSHVVVPMGRGEDPSSEVLIDAAHLAAHFSDAKGEPDVEVTYTRRRFVQKSRGTPAGSVRLLQEKTLLLRVEPQRLSRLLEGKVL